MMLDIQQKRKFKIFLYNKFTLLVLFVFVILAFHSTWKVYKKKVESIELKENSAKRLAELELRGNELDMKISKLNTESGIEEEIRSKYSVAKDNENIVIILNSEENNASNTVKKLNFWSKIRNIFR